MSGSREPIHLNQLGAAVTQGRKRLGITQADFAEALEYSSGGHVAVSRIERGLARPSVDKLARIILLIGVSPDAFFEEVRKLPNKPACEFDHDDRCVTSGLELEVTNLAVALAKEKYLSVDEWQKSLEAKREQLSSQNQAAIDEVLGAFNAAHKRFTEPLLALLNKLQARLDFGVDADVAKPENSELSKEEFATRERIATSLTTLATAGVSAGAASSAFAAAVYSSVAAFGTASTGAAISGLTGAAASSATLAWLGGGSLAAGGLGVAGGTVLLSSLIGIPVIAAVGAAYLFQSKARKDREKEIRKELADYEVKILRTAQRVETVSKWARTIARICEESASLGHDMLTTAKAYLATKSDSTVVDNLLDDCKQIAIDLTYMQTLPIWHITTANADSAQDDESHITAIDLSLQRLQESQAARFAKFEAWREAQL